MRVRQRLPQFDILERRHVVEADVSGVERGRRLEVRTVLDLGHTRRRNRNLGAAEDVHLAGTIQLITGFAVLVKHEVELGNRGHRIKEFWIRRQIESLPVVPCRAPRRDRS